MNDMIASSTHSPDLDRRPRDRPVVVIGSRGLLGGMLMRRLRHHPGVVGVVRGGVAAGSGLLGVPDRPAIARLVDRVRPSAVVATAALSDVDRCEADPAASWQANVTPALDAVDVCASLGIPMLYVSTDYVFDGAAGPYTEEDVPNPVNVYGRHKLHAEVAVRARSGGLVVRTSQLVGGSRPGGVDRLVAALRVGEVSLPTDQFGTPTSAADLAAVLARLCIDPAARSRVGSLLHVAGRQTMSRYAFGRVVAAAFGFGADAVRPAPAGSSPAALRPLRCGLRIDRARAEIGFRPLSLDAALTAAYHPDGTLRD